MSDSSSRALLPEIPSGFLGTRGMVLSEVEEAGHVLRVVIYVFPDGSACPYVEAGEHHDGASPMRLHALSTAVHLLQNVGGDEAFQIGNRERCFWCDEPAEGPTVMAPPPSRARVHACATCRVTKA